MLGHVTKRWNKRFSFLRRLVLLWGFELLQRLAELLPLLWGHGLGCPQKTAMTFAPSRQPFWPRLHFQLPSHDGQQSGHFSGLNQCYGANSVTQTFLSPNLSGKAMTQKRPLCQLKRMKFFTCKLIKKFCQWKLLSSQICFKRNFKSACKKGHLHTLSGS